MGVFDRVVVGVDGTDYGFEALRQAAALVPESAVVHAVTALDASVAVHAGFDMSHVSAQIAEEAERARAGAEEILGGRAGWTAKIVRGDVKSVLRAACSEHDATVLALGARRSSRFLGILAGETATTLLHEVAQSVLLARPQWGQRWQPRRILVGVDGSEPSLAALSAADDLAARLGSIVHVASAAGGKPVDRAGTWSERVQSWDPGHPVVALLDRSLHADLVIVGSRGLHGVRALGSVSERVAHRALCSTLVVHASPQPAARR
jgi:nucleotide-binding universal stress UspA family protein